ncbi:MAG: hypothetical protein CL483_12665 [Acidobacteria bacterium]|nr:hypothetical protein [Acidobacteriota bacterium]
MAESSSPDSLPVLPVVGQKHGRPGTSDGLGALLRTALRSWLGRSTAVAVLAKLTVSLFGDSAPRWLRVVDSAATIILVIAFGVFLLRVVALLQRRVLWRVRRKLVLSYLLIGFVPILLLVSFFLLAGTLLLSTVTSLLVQLSFEDVIDDVGGFVRATSIELGAHDRPLMASALLEQRVSTLSERYPEAGITVRGLDPSVAETRLQAGVGAWPMDPVANWVTDLTQGLVIVDTPQGRRVTARGTAPLMLDGRRFLVIADLPVSDTVLTRMERATGVELLTIGGSPVSAGVPDAAEMPDVQFRSAPTESSLTSGLPSIAFLDLLEWSTGEHVSGAVSFLVQPVVFYRQVVQGGNSSYAGALLFVLMAIGAMFLTIEAVALVMGFALAKSITGAVHELFTGTERVRQGDLDHRIQVATRDQLGELAKSFNAMTGSIADLLQEAEEKRRLEEELRIAREIQMSLLPDAPVSLPGLAVTALCRPAREVGGDYYDFVALDQHRLGVLVADVSGKGTSAALYMAELKGLILSLGQVYDSPKRLLIEVNRILSTELDNRTFITMTYAVVDLRARTLTYVRAGHTPLMHVSSQGPLRGQAQVLVPSGLVVGLQLEGIETRFAELLEECTVQIAQGDLFALFTDGITEAMNEDLDLFGEERLGRLLAEHAQLSSEDLRERILGAVDAFAGGADQHDDITIVLLRVDALGGATA